MSCGRVIATYASAIGAMNTPALPTTLIASCAPSAAMRIVLFPAAPSAASRIVFFSVSHTQNSLPKRLCSRATSWAHLETDSARHLEILCRFVLPAASAPRDGMPVACRGQCALHRLLGISRDKTARRSWNRTALARQPALSSTGSEMGVPGLDPFGVHVSASSKWLCDRRLDGMCTMLCALNAVGS